jgi:hypothetical protein
MIELVYCVTTILINPLPFKGDFRFGKIQKLQEHKFWLQEPGCCGALPKKNAFTRAVEWAGALSWWNWSACSVIVNATNRKQAQSTVSHCRLTSSTDPLWLAAKLHQGHVNGSRNIQNGWILSVQASYITWLLLIQAKLICLKAFLCNTQYFDLQCVRKVAVHLGYGT